MANYRVVLVAVLGVTIVAVGEGLQCMQCTGVSEPQDCITSVNCSDKYQCFTDFYVTEQGFVYYDLGCRIEDTCTVLNGRKRAIPKPAKRQFENLHLCEECCSTDFCNRQGCPDNTVNLVNNTVCFNCPDAANPGTCVKADVCNYDETCLATLVLTEMFQERYHLRCEKKQVCDSSVGGQFHGHPKSASMVFGKRQFHFPITECQYCCDTSFCNNKECVKGMPSTTAATTTTTKPPTTTTHKTTTTKPTTTTHKTTTTHPTTKPTTTTRKPTTTTTKPTTTTRKHTTKPTTTTRKHTTKPTTTTTTTHRTPPPTTTTHKTTTTRLTTTTTIPDQTSSFPTNAHTTRQTTPSTTTAATTTTKTPSSTTQKTTTSSQTFVTLPTTATTTRIHFIPITNPKTTQKPAPSKTLVTLTNPPGSTYVQHTPTLPNTQTTTQVPQVTTFMGTTSTQHIPTLNHAANTPPSRVSTQRTPTAITTQPTTATTTSTTTTTLPTTSTEPPANRCYSSNKDSNIQTVIGCPDEAPYCLNNLTNYASGKIEVSKGCATASQCYWIPRDDSSVYCDIYSSAHTYFADFMCSSCCTGELCNQDTVASPNTPFNPTVIPPNPITHSPLKSTECYTCDDCHDAGTLSTCSGNTPYCLNHYSSSQWGVTHITKRCGAKQECHSQYYEGTRNNLLCSVFDENIHDNMRLECVFCCTASNCNEHARPPQSTLYKE